ncbi:MAG: signal peptidase I [Candidatus Hydrogenedentes bacterium]|nr:signal peptidase I [Candidatus Hydrogenedentota bacterium]
MDDLRDEAIRLRKEYHYLRKALKQNPNDRALRKRAEAIQKRYKEIQHAEKTRPEDDGPLEAAPIEPIDMSIFEPKPYEVPPAVSLSKGSGTLGTARRSTLSPKTIWTALMVSILLLAAPFYYFMFFRGMSFYEVPTGSMIPTLQPHDRVVAMTAEMYYRGDVLVVEDPNDPAAFLVKRMVGLPGDIIEVKRGILFVNDTPIEEPYLREKMQYNLGPIEVAEDEVFLLGDNRNESDDSHVWGHGIPARKVTGRAFYIYHPADRRGTLPSHTDAFAIVPDDTTAQGG